MSTTRAIVLARGLGTRMRAPDPSAQLTPEQQRVADAGLKAMIPVNGRPFLDYILSSLADAAIRDVALVVGPEHNTLRRYYQAYALPVRVRIGFVVQDQALGTANAVLAAERWVQCEPVLTMNADYLYPVDALAALAALAEPGLPAFDPEDLMRSSNIAAERLRSFAFLETDDRGYLTGIVEKPNKVLPPNRLRPDLPSFGRGYGESAEALSASARRAPARPRRSSKSEVVAKAEGGSSISKNCWRFDERIFQACREVPRSARGEFEIPEAVGVAVRRGMPFKTFPARGPVLDLSTRADADDVARRLAGISPRP
jgi:dTDP-glucose pyrophosphorylase